MRSIPFSACLLLAACAGPQKISTADLSSDLQLQSMPTGAVVTESGRAIGKTPLWLTLQANRGYSLTFSAPGYASRTVGGTREELLHLGGGQLGVVLVPQGLTLRTPPSFDRPDALASIAIELEHRRAWAQAIQFWIRVVQLQPRNARAHRGLGSAYAKIGKDEDAIREYEQYLFLAPDADDAERVRHAVDAFRGGIDMPVRNEGEDQ
ncbi:MAG TPA: tetratricopeptide repeat protein [Myxococcales bacterium]|nr:tetratricopeptide repeat protein [Myxococcales bacterium]